MWDIVTIIFVCAIYLYLKWVQGRLTSTNKGFDEDLRDPDHLKVMVEIERVDNQLLVFREDNKLFLTQGTTLKEIISKLQNLPQNKPTIYLTYTQNLKELNLLE